MAHWAQAVQQAGGATRILVEVAAGARDARFPDGYNQWRDGRIGVRVQAPAQAGKANEEVVRHVAAFLAVPAGAVRIESGALDPRKAVLVEGLGRDGAVARLASALGA